VKDRRIVMIEKVKLANFLSFGPEGKEVDIQGLNCDKKGFRKRS
jgi:hypothetical protein